MRGAAPPLRSNTNQQVAVTRTITMNKQITIDAKKFASILKGIKENSEELWQGELEESVSAVKEGKWLKDLKALAKPTKKHKHEGEKYHAKCDECDSGFNEGFVVSNGENYYCSKKCLHKHITPKEWDELYNNGDGDSYYSEWEGDFYFQVVDGVLIEIEE